MEITSISRKISGFNYDNISATATVEPGEDVVEAAKKLDASLRRMLAGVQEQSEQVDSARREKEAAISTLKTALDYAENIDIPF